MPFDLQAAVAEWQRQETARSKAAREQVAHHRAQQQAEADRRAAERKARFAEAKRHLDALTDPIARIVLDLHREDDHGDCNGCEYSGYEAEPPEWPCSTVEAVAAHYGINLG